MLRIALTLASIGLLLGTASYAQSPQELVRLGAEIDGFRFEFPCKDPMPENPKPGADGVSAIATGDPALTDQFTSIKHFGGDPSKIYQVTLRVRGVVEPMMYKNGQQVGDYFYVGGEKNNATYNVYQISVSEPRQHYFLNRQDKVGHQIFTIDYQQTIDIAGGAKITFHGNGQNGRLITNFKKLVVPEIAPAPKPYNGQFIQLNVVDVQEKQPAKTSEKQSGKKAAKKGRSKAATAQTPPPTNPPLQTVDLTHLPAGASQLELFLLMGQSNMKGRGVMPTSPQLNPRIVMMHLKDDAWYLARHPIHLTGDARTFLGHDNAGVGPGLAFAEKRVSRHTKTAVGLIPCAVGGSPIQQWQPGAKLYEEAMRRAKLAVQSTGSVQGKIRGVLWLQGEANAQPNDLPEHAERLTRMIDGLRKELADPFLPFIACTIGEMGNEATLANQKAMNQILLSLPQRVPNTACVDARDLTSHIGDNVHFDTAAQNEIGKRFADLIEKLESKSSLP